MPDINIHAAKTQLSRLVDLASKGETIIIAKAGKPMAKLVPLEAGDVARPKRIGFMKGEFTIPDDFDTMCQEEIIRLFHGEEG